MSHKRETHIEIEDKSIEKKKKNQSLGGGNDIAHALYISAPATAEPNMNLP